MITFKFAYTYYAVSFTFDRDEAGYTVGKRHRRYPFRGTTVATMYEEGKPLFMAKAHCSVKDDYSYSKGAREAFCKLLEYQFCTKSFRAKAWEAFLEEYKATEEYTCDLGLTGISYDGKEFRYPPSGTFRLTIG